MYRSSTTDSDYITESMSETETETELYPTTDTKTEPNTSNDEEEDQDSSSIRNTERGRGMGSPEAGSVGRSSITLFDLSEDEFQELQETIYDLAEDFLKNEGSAMTVIGFKDKMIKHISDIMLDDLIEAEIFTYDHYEDIMQICKDVIDIYFDSMQIPDYVVIDTDTITLLDNGVGVSRGAGDNRRRIREQIEYLRKQPQPTQKSEEWYRERHTLLTASNIWKAVGSPAQQNSLIVEKCTPFVLQPYQQASGAGGGGGGYCNTASPMHWGNKYEPLTRMVYEHMHRTVVEDFGCIKHPQYPFIGASPDGINVDPESHRYGRMLEIKNIVNRDITGIPLEKYWIQVQIQLETCGLDLCDFVETRFKEYRREEFYRDIAAAASASDPIPHSYRGIILYFLEGRAGAPIYEYMPLWVKQDPTVIQNWTDAQIAVHASQGHTLFDTLYWFLDEYSCVTIERNRIWFDEIARPKLIALKSTIDRESVSGFQHRISSKTAKIPKITPSVCLIKLDAP